MLHQECSPAPLPNVAAALGEPTTSVNSTLAKMRLDLCLVSLVPGSSGLALTSVCRLDAFQDGPCSYALFLCERLVHHSEPMHCLNRRAHLPESALNLVICAAGAGSVMKR